MDINNIIKVNGRMFQVKRKIPENSINMNKFEDGVSLLKQFYNETGCPLLLNTSFNINGKPILGSIEDTQEYFYQSDIDTLVIGNTLLEK